MDKENKEEFVYFNDEWNAQWVNDPLMFPECSEKSLEYNRSKLIKNNKPDGRRYKK